MATVYAKTQLGVSAIQSSRESLSPSARRLLILVDGQRDLDELAAMLGAQSVRQDLPFLVNEGYIWPAQRSAAPPTIHATLPRDSQLGALNLAAAAPAAALAPSAAASLPPRTAGAARDSSGTTVRLGLGLVLAAGVAGTIFWLWNSRSTPPQVSAPAAAPAPVAEPAPTPITIPSSPPAANAPAPAVPPQPILAVPDAAPVERRPADSDKTSRKARNDKAAAIASASAEAPAGNKPAAPAPAPAAVASAKMTAASDSAAVRAPAPPAPSPAAAPGAASAAAPAANAGAAPAASPPTPAVTPAPLAAAATGSAAATPPAPAPVALVPRNRPLPDLPRRARKAGVDHGTVVVRLHINAGGTVERVELLRADPPQVYDDQVQQTLAQWTFNPPGQPVAKNFELNFRP